MNYNIFKMSVFHKQLISNEFNLYDSILTLSVSLLSITSLLINYKIYETAQFVFYYFILDLFLFKKKKDIIIHHILVICMYLNYYILNGSNEDFIKFYKIIVLVEASSIFLLIKNIINEKKLYCPRILQIFINISFIFNFIYFRIYYYYYNLLRKNQLFDIIANSYLKGYFDTYFYYFSFYGFYILNLYWSSLIIKKLIFFYIKNIKNIK